MANLRPNFFELLELDPTAPWDHAHFENTLKSRRAEWVSQSRHPRHALRYKGYLDLIADIQAVMADPMQRQAEAEAALRVRDERHARRRREFADELELLAAKGYITHDEIDFLATEYNAVLDITQIYRQIELFSIDIRPAPENRIVEIIDSSTMQDIRAQLEIINRRNVYDFLGMPPTTTTSALLEAARRVYEETLRQNKITAERTAKSVLSGHALQIFKDEGKRRKYDRALNRQTYDVLLEKLERLLRGPDKTLYAGQIEHLLVEAQANGLDPDKASRYLYHHAGRLGATIEFTLQQPSTPVMTRSLGVIERDEATRHERVRNLIFRRDKLPATAVLRVVTYEAMQRLYRLQIAYNQENRPVCKVQADHEIWLVELQLPPGLAANTSLEVVFSVDEDEQLIVQVRGIESRARLQRLR